MDVFFTLVLLAMPFLALYFGVKSYKLNKLKLMLIIEKHALEIDKEKLSSEVEELSPYRQIIDAEAEAKSIKQEADMYRINTTDEANKKATQITHEAELRAEEIAGSAIEAKENAKRYKDIVKAMKNAIKGYGNEYIIPNHSLLDDLAEEFGFKEAGESLKEARGHSRSLLKSDKAASCDYAEPNRKETAIRFVIDAFNGKVDTALSKAKHDNFGKLEQEIKDAFSLVNDHGIAFRNARINQEYLESRLKELHWAVATNELKLIEKEEQRAIKQAMREEEQARREYEKAIKEAEKEERMLQKAMEEARKHLDLASAEEKAKYEQQLQELQTQLSDAEDKNQRAISMAQQTRRGHVYVISNIGSFGEDIYKIGMTRRLEPLDRVKELGDASVPFSFDIHAMIHSEDAPALEKILHKKFIHGQVNKVNQRKEFFNVSIHDIKDSIQDMDIEVSWTMTAEAKEYRESIAILNEPIEEISSQEEELLVE